MNGRRGGRRGANVRVESVDDQAHQLIDLSLELESLNSHF